MLSTLTRALLRRHGLGYRPDDADPRDRLAAELALPTTPPPRADLTPWVRRIVDQGSTASCVGQAWATALAICDAQRGFGDRERDSALFHYWNARALEGAPGVDDGTKLRHCAKAIIKYGRPPESAWPFSVLKINRKPSIGAYRRAFDSRGDHGYYRVELSDLDMVRRALAAGKPIVAGWRIDEGFREYDGTGAVRDGGKQIGGHAMVISGYHGDSFTLVNSWGESYGRRGLALVSDDFVARGYDGWIVSYS